MAVELGLVERHWRGVNKFKRVATFYLGNRNVTSTINTLDKRGIINSYTLTVRTFP
jgi:hypothetical protein